MKQYIKEDDAHTSFMTGTFHGNAKGFGFVSVTGKETDFFIPEGLTETALDGDEVAIKARPFFYNDGISFGRAGRKQEAEVVHVTKRNTTEIVGTFYGRGQEGFVVPDNRRISSKVWILAGDTKGAANGHKVVAAITDYGEKFSAGRVSLSGESKTRPVGSLALTGKITEILGHMDDLGVDILSIVKAYHLPEGFPDGVMNEAVAIPQQIPEDISSSGSREDLRDELIVTIDAEDTKDIDDAISVKKIEDGDAVWELGVHIADVAEYVKEDSPLDKEALRRGNSNYLVDRVIPMLPHELSNGICSLNPGEDRLSLSCIMKLSRSGEVLESRIVETVIRSRAKLSYRGVLKLFQENDESEIKEQLKLQGVQRGLSSQSKEIASMLKRGRRLSRILSKKRKKQGEIEFDLPECKVVLDSQGKVSKIDLREKNEASILIENFMIAANETVAKTFYEKKVPFVFRTHGKPKEEKLKQLNEFVRHYGYTLHWEKGKIRSKDIQKLLFDLKGKPEENMISMQVLRSMQRAEYTTKCEGHFGLALSYYCHFTSPIRRYADLEIHRIIKEDLHHDLTKERKRHYQEILPEICKEISFSERRSDEVERETDRQKMCEYMEVRLGESFEGRISAVLGSGFYVQLPNTIEGYVPAKTLRDDWYEFHEETMQLVGRHTGKTYRLGDLIQVIVSSVDCSARTITFELDGSVYENRKRRKKHKKDKKKEKKNKRKKSLQHKEKGKKKKKSNRK